MKKIIAIVSLFFILSGFAQAIDITTTAVEAIKEEVRICTMEYAPVCSVTGITYGNKCMAGENKIAYAGECDKYIDNELLGKLSIQKNRLSKKLDNVSDEKLVKAIEKADRLIANTKLLKIVESVQKERITKYKFLRDLISEELASR